MTPDPYTVTEWTWKQNNFVAVHDVTTDRAVAEEKARRCKAANPNAVVSVVRRQVTSWEPDLNPQSG